MAMAAFWNRRQSAPTKVHLDEEGSARIDEYITAQIAPDVPGMALAVVEAGTVVHAAGYGLADFDDERPIAPETIFHLASCGKQFTGLGILMLAEERRLNLDDPIGKHFSPLAGFGSEVTLRRLLHHTSGIGDLYDDIGENEALSRWERPTNANIIELYAKLGCPMAAQGVRPGDDFVYSNSGYELLGSVIENASGESYHDFFQRRVFDPLGMKDTFSVPDPREHDSRRAIAYGINERDEWVEEGDSPFDGLVGSGSFYTTLGDLCLYDQALNRNGLISPAAMQEALTSGRKNNGDLTGYGFGWFLDDYKGMPFAEHKGKWIGFNSYIRRYLERPLSLYVLLNSPEIDFTELANVVTDTYG
jgi:CubicO group peptidase (beta-lactamase class C family)